MGKVEFAMLLLVATMPLSGFAQQGSAATTGQGKWWSESRPATEATPAAAGAPVAQAAARSASTAPLQSGESNGSVTQAEPMGAGSGQGFDCVEVRRFETVTGFIQNKKDARAATIPTEKLTAIQSLVAGYIPVKLARIKSTTAENGAPECPDPSRALVLGGKITDYKKGNQALRYFVGFGAGAQKFSVQARVTRKSDGKLLAEDEITDYKVGGWIGGQADKGQDDFAEKVVDFLKKSLADKR